jgi:Glyoxalase/Bleomycin resistance protein/Dioxygenase superfamily
MGGRSQSKFPTTCACVKESQPIQWEQRCAAEVTLGRPVTSVGLFPVASCEVKYNMPHQDTFSTGGNKPKKERQMGTVTFRQLGLVVSNLEEAMEELTAALGLEWDAPQERVFLGWSLRIVHSTNGPLEIELCEGGPGGPWDPTPGARYHHLSYTVDNFDAESRRLEGLGVALTFDGRADGRDVAYCTLPKTGLIIEPISSAFVDELMHGRESVD